MAPATTFEPKPPEEPPAWEPPENEPVTSKPRDDEAPKSKPGQTLKDYLIGVLSMSTWEPDHDKVLESVGMKA